METRVDLEAIRGAHERIRPFTHRTPVLTSQALDRLVGARIHFKCENFQKTGAFKARGALNSVLTLNAEEAARGVLTHSSGNHAGALAWAAKIGGTTARLVMPANSTAVKVAAVEGYGGEVVFCEPALESRETTAAALQRETQAHLVHPYDDDRIIAGQGTAAVELIEQIPDVDVIIVPVGGGGLLSGTLLAAKGLKRGVQVIAAEPAHVDDTYQSWKEGKIVPAQSKHTVADGLRALVGVRNFGVIHRLVDDVLLVSETEILSAMRLVIERMKIVIEPSAAVPVAALLASRERFQGKEVGVILSGGNVDLAQLAAQAE